jgi:hypothetical protein
MLQTVGPLVTLLHTPSDGRYVCEAFHRLPSSMEAPTIPIASAKFSSKADAARDAIRAARISPKLVWVSASLLDGARIASLLYPNVRQFVQDTAFFLHRLHGLPAVARPARLARPAGCQPDVHSRRGVAPAVRDRLIRTTAAPRCVALKALLPLSGSLKTRSPTPVVSLRSTTG